MKVKSFKVLPGVAFNGDDKTHIGLEADLDDDDPAKPTKLSDAAVKDEDFKKLYTFSLDGEQYDPGHGWQFEVHQGLARFVCGEDGKYRKSFLYKPLPHQTIAPQPPRATVPNRPHTSAAAVSGLAAIAGARPATATTRPTVDILQGPIEPPPPPIRPPTTWSVQGLGVPGDSGAASVVIDAVVPPVAPATGPAAPIDLSQGGAPPVGDAAAAPVGAPPVGADASADGAGVPAPPPADSDA
jgi:hypothetical protein